MQDTEGTEKEGRVLETGNHTELTGFSAASRTQPSVETGPGIALGPSCRREAGAGPHWNGSHLPTLGLTQRHALITSVGNKMHE